MENWIINVMLVLGCACLAYGYRIRSTEFNEPQKACGDRLADVLRLVCKDRGYFEYFATPVDYRERRSKRGIVDECCHSSGCSYHTLEQYCKPLVTEAPDNTQIRKRSDNNKSWEEPLDKDIDEAIERVADLAEISDSDENRNSLLESSNKEKNLLWKSILTEDDNAPSNEQQIRKESIDAADNENAVVKLIRNGAENRKNSQENLSNFHENESYNNNGRRHVSDPSESSDKVRHSGDRQHRYQHTSLLRRIALKKEENESINQQRQEASRSVFSQVGIERPYFLQKELVNPYVRPAVNFAINSKQNQPY